MRQWGWALLALAMGLAVWVSKADAAAPPTLISDVLYKSDGMRFDGTALIEWKTFDGSATTVPPLTLRILYGVVRVQLAPTTTATPTAFYRVRFSSNGSTFTEYWAVQPSTVSLRLRDIRIQGPLDGNSTSPQRNSAILITDVSGLRAELDSRPVKGTAFAGPRAAKINSSGAIDAVSGSLSDCVKVDGTSGACGTGGGGGGPVFVDSEAPTGAVDGSNGTFLLVGTPSPSASLQVFRNGMLQKAGVDFTLTGATVTFLSGAIPQGGDVVQVYYRK